MYRGDFTHDSMMLSIIVPVYNEVECIELFLQRLKNTLASFIEHYEIIFVDNNSSDDSGYLLRKIFTREQNLKIIYLSRNFGQIAAILSAIGHARGSIIVIMDIDLQLFPEEIPKLINKLQEGFDVVFGYRVKRKDAFFRVFFSYIMNRIINYKVGIKVIDWGCSFVCAKESIVRSLVDRYGVNARFAKQLIAIENKNRIAQVEVGHVFRKHGTSRYNAITLFRIALDFILHFSTKLEKKNGEIFMIEEVLSK